ncbi:hypothetical protein Acsp06_20540 [Actinomycetospora sp. NBRC 106375]|uniref:hypothetical protein n=1 Tax=Actinomycetospora sp. NBRC 106375 TaxID=3032207 RepID=UPI0024A38A1A|nr:hypothetical protein [Actinomycetospora sp. NBRC 106375]GLZ45869.1 hypothetical protein Acsp06_20540 [Actinomycetospora sp. NBRC 106375]
MYRVETVGDDIDAAIEALPPEFVAGFLNLWAALGDDPWAAGRPYVASNPRGSQTATFGPDGRGLALFVVHDREHVVATWQIMVAPETRG